MTVLYYDCFCGISGDMHLGALIDIGVDREYLRTELKKLSVSKVFSIDVQPQVKKGIRGTRVSVTLKQQEHGHRHISDVDTIIDASDLNKKVKSLSKRIFKNIAEAEAKVHGIPIEKVHFHEVGAVDSIVDIVGAAICLDFLNVDRIISSPVQLGGGFVECAHGKIPVPAPATLELLKGKPIKTGLVESETTTPTGAAILATIVDEYTEHIELEVSKIGYGIGYYDLEVPNVLRVVIGDETVKPKTESAFMIETNIDDMNPEIFGYVQEKLLETGAADVFMTPIIMKKGRSATKLNVLCQSGMKNAVMDVIFRETSSIGMRFYPVEKAMLERDFVDVTTQYGKVSVKRAYYQGQIVNYKAEYEDCRKAAVEHSVPIKEVYGEVDRLMMEKL